MFYICFTNVPIEWALKKKRGSSAKFSVPWKFTVSIHEIPNDDWSASQASLSITKSKSQPSWMCLAQLWAACSFSFPATVRTTGGTPWKATCLSLSRRHTQQQIKSSCDVVPRKGDFPLVTGYLWHLRKWSEVGMLSVPYSPQSLRAVSQIQALKSEQNFFRMFCRRLWLLRS